MSAARLDDAQTASLALGPDPSRAPLSVLLFHGFTGSPWELQPLAESLAARGYAVRVPRLPGHGTTPEAMLWSGHREWLQHAHDALQALPRDRPVILGGLSMGALVAMVIAARRTRRIEGLLLLAPVVRFRSRSLRALRGLRALPIPEWGPTWLAKDGVDIDDLQVRAGAPLLPRLPLARLFDLFELQALAKHAEARLTCPSLVMVSQNDHVVDPQAALALSQRLPFSKSVLLQRGAHIIPRDLDRALALTECAHFVEGLAR